MPVTEHLTRREREILALLAEGYTAPEIAAQLTLALSTVKYHISNLYGKLGVNRKRQAVSQARDLGLLKAEPGKIQPVTTGPVSSQTGPKHNLPLPLTTFFGHEGDIVQVKRLLSRAKLVTLTGPGGIGKTRLALQIARERVPEHPHGVWFAELAPLPDPALISQAVSIVLGVRERQDQRLVTALTDYLREKNLLLLLDNCEHAIEACAQFAKHLLEQCPTLHILATSRETLGVQGEVTFPVPPLSTPDLHPPATVETLSNYESVHLFVERCRLVWPGFALTPENVSTIVQICYFLEGIPLAIELAAARIQLLSLDEIASHLARRNHFRLLTQGSRTTIPRHQTLHALVDWSYNLLSESERVLWQWLTVFVGGWTLEAAEAVAADAQQLDGLDGLTQLVNKSLIVAERQQDGRLRYRMLETLRQYAHEKLMAAGELETLRQRAFRFFFRMAELAEPHLRGPDQLTWLDRLEADYANIRAALEWSLETDVDLELQLASALLWFWYIRGRSREGLEWLDRGLSRGANIQDEQPLSLARTLIRGRALNAAGFLCEPLGERDRAEKLFGESLALFNELGPTGKVGLAYALLGLNETQDSNIRVEESLALFREVGDKFGIAQCLYLIGRRALIDGRIERASDLLEENSSLRQELGDREGLGLALCELGHVARAQGNNRRATRLYQESLTYYRALGNNWMIGALLTDLAWLACDQNDIDQAARLFDEALAFQRDVGEAYFIGNALCDVGMMARVQGDYDKAADRYEEALTVARQLGQQGQIIQCLCGHGEVAWSQGKYESSAQQFREALAVSRDGNDPRAVAPMLCWLARVSHVQGDNEKATRLYLEAASLGQELGDKWALAAALDGLGRVAHARTDFASAASFYSEALAMRQALRDEAGMLLSIHAMAALAAALLQANRAVRLFGAAEPLAALVWVAVSPKERLDHKRHIAALRTALGEAEFLRGWTEGKAMPLEAAIAYARHTAPEE